MPDLRCPRCWHELPVDAVTDAFRGDRYVFATRWIACQCGEYVCVRRRAISEFEIKGSMPIARRG